MEEKRENAYLDYDDTIKCCLTNGHCIREFGETCEGCEEMEENNG